MIAGNQRGGLRVGFRARQGMVICSKINDNTCTLKNVHACVVPKKKLATANCLKKQEKYIEFPKREIKKSRLKRPYPHSLVNSKLKWIRSSSRWRQSRDIIPRNFLDKDYLRAFLRVSTFHWQRWLSGIATPSTKESRCPPAHAAKFMPRRHYYLSKTKENFCNSLFGLRAEEERRTARVRSC